MRAVVQRALSGRVLVEGEVVGELPRPGLVILLGVGRDDTPAIAAKLADKIYGLRIMEGERSASDLGAPVLVVSQFTLYADIRKGRRPSWGAAAPGPVSQPLVAAAMDAFRNLGAEVSGGRFGADMQVELVNDGPVTIMVDTDT